ncbi:FAD/NAD(P)-binding domain-containing protein [Aspergillus campestris IBT 28561]|uniref:FAD/NAD(P)-binding domain-containing protein n=1 Tax=Aspergillus campestris (strain IBT 28561) TaxID=1392248 RepID=A0A2I1D3X7_ASPC2|nr:FAD/NAD(P)-binding domain-containing protein [Aspergillus campestris IBT 28561]PKY04558.1 FAD/NAD(P)-binding domain-containing protein [Aspergillus campestris IBT 28561]
MTITADKFCRLNVAVIGGGIGGLASAIALRRSGHVVTIYEQCYQIRDAGASISFPANGTKWLDEWGVDITLGKPTSIQKQIRHDLETGDVQDVLEISNYTERWGYEHYNFYRKDMHRMLLEAAIGPGEGKPATLKLDHSCKTLDLEKGSITFRNETTVQHDIIIGADGIGSSVRQALGIVPERRRATSTCYHCVIRAIEVHRLGFPEMAGNSALEYWGQGLQKIVYSACRSGDIQSFYLFFPLSSTDSEQDTESWDGGGTHEELLRSFPKLDPRLRTLLSHSVDIHPWRLFEHLPYARWQWDRTCIMGDAAHPMLPDQSQGACQAIEDAAALGIIFSQEYSFSSNISAGLQLYENIRKPRATKVQAASARARKNLSERIGFSSQLNSKLYSVESENEKLTIEEINGYNMKEHIASQANVAYRNPG